MDDANKPIPATQTKPEASTDCRSQPSPSAASEIGQGTADSQPVSDELKNSRDAEESISQAGPAQVEPAPAGQSHEGVLQKISHLPVPGKIRLALVGNREERLALIRDTNRSVSRAVLESPKVSEGEMEVFAAMPDLAEDIYRLISKNVTFMKNHAAVRGLVNNPRVPLDISLPLVKRLNARELRDLKNNRNVPTALRNLAAKTLTPR